MRTCVRCHTRLTSYRELCPMCRAFDDIADALVRNQIKDDLALARATLWVVAIFLIAVVGSAAYLVMKSL
jgi:hypothetical protein